MSPFLELRLAEGAVEAALDSWAEGVPDPALHGATVRLLRAERRCAELLEGREAVTAFEQLVELEPGLRRLYDAAVAVRGGPTFCANAAFYGSLHMLAADLVGDSRRPGGHPALRSSAAYDCACRALYDALPDCGTGCACSRGAARRESTALGPARRGPKVSGVDARSVGCEDG